MEIVVGTTALEISGIHLREPSDLDLWHTHGGKIEGDSHQIPEHIMKLVPAISYNNQLYATPDAIYTIKCSHAAWDIKWDKTMADIRALKERGCKIIDQLFWALYDHWKTVHGNKDFLSLNKQKDEFFNDYVPYVYDHDKLHEVVALPNRPMYERCLKDGEEVLIDKDKFMAMPFEDRVRLFKEEIYVIAIERFLLTSKKPIAINVAYKKALKKTITNLTKNWASLFIIDNYQNFVRMGDRDWYHNFLNFIGEEKMESTIFDNIREKATQLGIDPIDVEDSLIHGCLGTEAPDPEKDWYKESPEWYAQQVKHFEFDQYLLSLGYKLIQSEGGEGEGESAFSVIELEGELYRMDYAYYSYEGYDIDDLYGDWVKVQPVEKTITVYEVA